MISARQVLANLQEKYSERIRKADVEILWPALLDLAPTRQEAFLSFLLHAQIDRAWQGFTDEEIGIALGVVERETPPVGETDGDL